MSKIGREPVAEVQSGRGQAATLQREPLGNARLGIEVRCECRLQGFGERRWNPRVRYRSPSSPPEAVPAPRRRLPGFRLHKAGHRGALPSATGLFHGARPPPGRCPPPPSATRPDRRLPAESGVSRPGRTSLPESDRPRKWRSPGRRFGAAVPGSVPGSVRVLISSRGRPRERNAATGRAPMAARSLSPRASASVSHGLGGMPVETEVAPGDGEIGGDRKFLPGADLQQCAVIANTQANPSAPAAPGTASNRRDKTEFA